VVKSERMLCGILPTRGSARISGRHSCKKGLGFMLHVRQRQLTRENTIDIAGSAPITQTNLGIIQRKIYTTSVIPLLVSKEVTSKFPLLVLNFVDIGTHPILCEFPGEIPYSNEV